MIKLVLTDLDDTLVPLGSDGSVSAEALEAIHVMLDAGLHFGPMTGRVPAGVVHTFRGDASCYATGAFANGQIVMLDGEIYHLETCPVDALQRTADIMDEVGSGALALYDVFGEDKSAWFVSNDPVRCENGFGWKLRSYPCEPRVTEPSLKANVHVSGTREQLVQLRDLLRREVPELDFVFPSNTAPLIDILPAGYGKGSAARILAEGLGIGLDEVATFGDSENDLSMLRAVPNSVAVANASPEAMAAARWRCGAAVEQGVAKALLDIAAASATGEMPTFMRE